jgi:hypothetical protein
LARTFAPGNCPFDGFDGLCLLKRQHVAQQKNVVVLLAQHAPDKEVSNHKTQTKDTNQRNKQRNKNKNKNQMRSKHKAPKHNKQKQLSTWWRRRVSNHKTNRQTKETNKETKTKTK